MPFVVSRRTLRCAILLLVLAAATGCRAPSIERPRQVILVLLDAARPDRFSCYDYARETTPEIDRLARNGAVFRHHYAQGTDTRTSIPTLLYSRYFSAPIFPNDPNVPYAAPEELFRRFDAEQISLARAFELAGFETAAISAHFWTGEDTPFSAEFMEMHDLSRRHGSSRYPYPRARRVIDETIGWIRRHRDEEFFLYVHLMDTHYPHYFEADAQELFGASSYAAKRFRESGEPTVPTAALTEDDRRYVDALYDGSLRYADREIGRMLGYLREEGLLDNAIVALTSDHGEHLLEESGGATQRAVFSHGGLWLVPVARIPLVVHAPGRLDPGRFEELSEGVDVAPTLLGLAGVELPTGKTFDGVDLAVVLAGKAEPRQQASMPGGIRTATHKCLFANRRQELLGRQPPETGKLKGRLYDLRVDPGEATNLFRTDADRVTVLLKQFRLVMQAPFERAQAARSSEQPRAAFAISAKHAVTDVEIPRIEGGQVPPGWSRLVGSPHSALIAMATAEPLAVRFRIPDGTYRLSLGMAGRATVEVNGRELELQALDGRVDFGDVEVTGEVFRATLRPQGDSHLRIVYFGFVPPAAGTGPAMDEERLRRLRALGYVE